MIKPLNKNVLIKRQETTTKSGLIMPVENEKFKTAEVIAVGSKVEEVAVGDIIRYGGEGQPMEEFEMIKEIQIIYKQN